MGIPKSKPDIHVDKSLPAGYNWKDNKTIEKVVRNLASAGLPNEDIAQLLGVRLATLQNRVSHIPNLKAALVEGRDEATQIMVSKMFQTAIGGQIYQEIREKINHKGQHSTEVITKECHANPILMMYWLNNNDPENWKDRQLMAQERKEKTKRVSSTTESDKIARLSHEVFAGDTVGPEGKHRVPKETAHPTGEGAVDAGHLPGDVHGEATDNIQDNALDVPAEAGAEPLQAPSV